MYNFTKNQAISVAGVGLGVLQGLKPLCELQKIFTSPNSPTPFFVSPTPFKKFVDPRLQAVLGQHWASLLKRAKLLKFHFIIIY